MDTPCLSILSTSEIVGLSFIAESGVISAVAVLVFAGLVVRNVIDDRRNPGPNGPTPLIRTHVDGYMISLMFADLLQAFGAFTSAKWAARGHVECSAYCTAQGFTQTIGETGVALSTLVITIHTFATVFFRWQPSLRPRLWIAVVSFVWTAILLFVVLSYVIHQSDEKNGGPPYFSPTPFWCWINSSYLFERIFGEYFWIWFSAVLNMILYPFLFFTLRGNIDVDPSNWRRIRFHRRGRAGIFGGIPSALNSASRFKDPETLKYEKMRNHEAMKMFWYPISYTVLVLPLTINRWSTFGLSKNTDQPVASISIVPSSIVVFIFGLSGLVNVILFLLTRPKLLLFNVRRERLQAKRQATVAAESYIHFRRDSVLTITGAGGGGTGQLTFASVHQRKNSAPPITKEPTKGESDHPYDEEMVFSENPGHALSSRSVLSSLPPSDQISVMQLHEQEQSYTDYDYGSTQHPPLPVAPDTVYSRSSPALPPLPPEPQRAIDWTSLEKEEERIRARQRPVASSDAALRRDM